MSIEINTGNSAQNAQKLSQAMFESLSKTSGSDATEFKEVVSKAMEVLSGASVTVTRSDNTSVTGTGEKKTMGATSAPALDNPDDIAQKEANLSKLVSYLQLDNEERQTDMANERIELQQKTLDTEHKSRMNEIENSIQKMKDAEKASLASRIFGWIGAVLSVIAAVALTLVTGGAAAGFAIAGAVLAVSSLVLNETGAMESITEKLTEALKESGMSKNDAKLAASLIVSLAIVALSVGCSVGGMVSGVSSAANGVLKLSESALNVAKTVQNSITVANSAVGTCSLASGGTSTYFTYRSESAKADVTELEKFITTLRQRLDESEEELKQILQQIENGIGVVADMVSSATDTSDEIARNLGHMA